MRYATRISLKFFCVVLSFTLLMGISSVQAGIVDSTRKALDILARKPVSVYTGGAIGGTGSSQWMNIVGCDCTTEGISKDSSDALCNIQCCRDKYGDSGYAVNTTCCKKDDDDCVCKANGCKTGDLATPLDYYCCAYAQGLI